MFDNDDYEYMVNNQMRVPDGLIDGRQYAEIFQSLNKNLEEMNPSDYASTIMWVMRCINECYDDSEDSNVFSKERASDVVTALSYFTMTMMNALTEMGVRDEYFRHQYEVVIPQMLEECESIPWYDFSDEIKKHQQEEDGE